MSTSNHCYARPPVVEAIIDLHLAFDTPPSPDSYKACIDRLSADFPLHTPINTVKVGVNTSESNATYEQNQVGYRLSSDTNSRVLQLKNNAFTVSQLPPYPGWSDFFEMAKLSWTAYLEAFKPIKVTRVAVRFINKVVIPAGRVELEDYFNLGYKIPNNIQQDTVAFLLQLALPQQDIEGVVCNLNFVQTPSEKPDTVSLVLDLDLYKSGEFDPSSDDVLGLISKMRTRKNEIFESCITDKTRELFK
jgi:uncharacterized protein (TIGR04255 family)